MSCTSKHLLAGVICGLTSNEQLKTLQKRQSGLTTGSRGSEFETWACRGS